jgi:hypothetical protein
LVSALLLSVGVLAALIGAWRLKSIDPSSRFALNDAVV